MGSEAQAKRDRKRAIELMVKRLPRIELELHRYWELWHWHMQYVWLAIGEQMKQKAANERTTDARDMRDFEDIILDMRREIQTTNYLVRLLFDTAQAYVVGGVDWNRLNEVVQEVDKILSENGRTKSTPLPD